MRISYKSSNIFEKNIKFTKTKDQGAELPRRSGFA
jgi:hypothetical protein